MQLLYTMTTEKKKSSLASLYGSAVSGILEISLFHPFDTATKRLISNEKNVIGKTFPETNRNLKQVILGKHASKGWVRGIPTLYPGLKFATSYKLSQRVYKYSGQHFVKNYLLNNHKNGFNNIFGEKYGNTMISAVSGSMIGVGEIALLPLDVLKIKSQTNPEALKGRGLIKIIKDEGMNLYSGSAWTATRNAVGSFTLFGTSTLLKSQVFGLDINEKATFWQHFVCSTGASTTCILVSSPMDVIKTRIQIKDFKEKVRGGEIVKNIVKREGIRAFFKGIGPKLLTIGPKLTFSFTVAQYFIQYFDDILSKQN